MGGAGPNTALGLPEKKKLGFQNIDIPNTTSGLVAALDGSVLLHNSFGNLETKVLRDVAIGLHHELATEKRYDLPVMLVGAISHVCEVWFEFLSATLKVACVKVVFDGQHTEGKKDEREKRMKERTAAYQKAMQWMGKMWMGMP